MTQDPNDPNRVTSPRTDRKETYVEPVERKSSALPLIIGVLLALALAYFVLTRFMGEDTTVVEDDAPAITTTEEVVEPAVIEEEEPVIEPAPVITDEAEETDVGIVDPIEAPEAVEEPIVVTPDDGVPANEVPVDAPAIGTETPAAPTTTPLPVEEPIGTPDVTPLPLEPETGIDAPSPLTADEPAVAPAN